MSKTLSSLTIPDAVFEFAKGSNTVYVETGTGWGGSISSALRAGFDEVHSIDFAENTMVKMARETHWGNSRVSLYIGRSSPLVLPEVLERLEVPTTILLDAHGHGGGAPLIAELQALVNLGHQHHTIMIDDMAQVGKVDWMPEDKHQILDRLDKINPKYEIRYFDSKILWPKKKCAFLPQNILIALPS